MFYMFYIFLGFHFHSWLMITHGRRRGWPFLICRVEFADFPKICSLSRIFPCAFDEVRGLPSCGKSWSWNPWTPIASRATRLLSAWFFCVEWNAVSSVNIWDYCWYSWYSWWILINDAWLMIILPHILGIISKPNKGKPINQAVWWNERGILNTAQVETIGEA